MMKIHYSLTAEDYREYQQAYLTRIAGFWQRNHFSIFLTFGTIVFVTGLNWIFFEHRQGYPGFVSIVGGLYLIFLGVWGRLNWRGWFRKNAHLYHDLDGEITEDTLTVRSKTEETRTKWDHYSRFVESSHLVIRLDPQENWLVLPKRAFAPADLESFLQLLRGRLEHPAR